MAVLSTKKLHTKSQYDAVFANRKTINNKYFKIFWRYNDLTNARIGISVAKRNINKAVNRNKLKRLVKESFRLNNNKLPAIDIVLVVKKEAGEDTAKKLFTTELNKKWANLSTQENLH